MRVQLLHMREKRRQDFEWMVWNATIRSSWADWGEEYGGISLPQLTRKRAEFFVERTSKGMYIGK